MLLWFLVFSCIVNITVPLQTHWTDANVAVQVPPIATSRDIWRASRVLVVSWRAICLSSRFRSMMAAPMVSRAVLRGLRGANGRHLFLDKSKVQTAVRRVALLVYIAVIGCCTPDSCMLFVMIDCLLYSLTWSKFQLHLSQRTAYCNNA